MRALLIDNYDSFTFNLAQLWAMVTGQPPTVVRNDDWETWKELELHSFGAVLISPGPGRPDRELDFGMSSTVLDGPIPLLGVCLGYQGLAVAEGARLIHAPEPMHGRTSPISHHGTDLFAGLPSPFQAARYHSLMVTEVPPSLEITATTPDLDGAELVMAVRHRTRAQWGVQFHPESIATEHGSRLLGNFAGLARASQQIAVTCAATPESTTPEVIAPEAQGGSEARTRSPQLRLLTRHLDREPHCPDLFARLFAGQDHAYWLDGATPWPAPSTSHQPPESNQPNRLSILGGLGELGEVVSARAGGGQVSVLSADQTETLLDGDLFTYLGQQLAARAIESPHLPFDFALGYVGYLGYELKADCGGDLANHADLPDAMLLFSDRAVVVDHETGHAWALALATDGTQVQAQAWLVHAAATAAACTAPTGEPTPLPPADDSGSPLDVAYRHSPEQYASLIQQCLAQIRDGESYEICLTNALTVPVVADPLATFLALRSLSPAPHAALLRTPAVSIASASPERFLRISPSGRIQAKPIKGTRRRGQTPHDDAVLAQDLATSVKDRSENLMIVDLLRNDLGSVAALGTVEVTRLFDVETFTSVHQLVSTVEAQLDQGRTAIDCVRASFPGGSMTGAPKRRTMQIIDRLEGGPRGVYSGALGYFSLNQAVDLSIVIRTLVIHPDHVTLGTGGAIVALSDPQAEVDEMLLKAQSPLRALRQALGQSLR
jgi:para-aminobenzoate synthetase